VKSGDVLGVIAERHGVGLSDLRSWNNIRGSRIYAGQKLAIWVKPSQARLASSSSPVSIPDSKVHLVQPGDSLWEISRRYQGVSVETIKQLNNLTSNKITPGQKLIIGR
jgi:membrane-bound lytic murein transglycosylase D